MYSYEGYAKIRDSKKLKDSDIARIADIPQSTFSDWKKGKSYPKTQKLKKIADALECDMSTLLSAIFETTVVYMETTGEKTEAQVIAELYENAPEEIKYSIRKLLNYDDHVVWKD